MRNNIMTIMKKEFYRFFKDRRMVVSTIIMPGLMIYVLYSFMGEGLSSVYTTEDTYIASVYAENLPESIAAMNKETLPVEFTPADGSEIEKAKQELENGGDAVDAVIVFPENFEAAVANYRIESGEPAPEIELYYNSTDTDSSSTFALLQTMLEQYETAMSNKFNINSGNKAYDLATEEDMTGQIFSMMIPMLMMIFLFSGCMAVAPESIAGEKERGTIATLLVTPMKRGQLALGKIISLSIIAILSGLSSFIGTMLSLPAMMGEQDMDASFYQLSDYLLLLGIILSTVLLLISLIGIISAFAKNVKEAATWVMPLMIVVMLIGVTSMMDTMHQSGLAWYFIPLYNSVQCMNGIFSFSYTSTNIVVTIVSNLVYTGVCVQILTRMFNSEKVMFSK